MVTFFQDLFKPRQNDSIMFTPRKERTFTEMLNSMAQKKTESAPTIKSAPTENEDKGTILLSWNEKSEEHKETFPLSCSSNYIEEMRK